MISGHVVLLHSDGDIDADTEELAEIRKWAIEKLPKLKAIFPKRIENCMKQSKAETV